MPQDSLSTAIQQGDKATVERLLEENLPIDQKDEVHLIFLYSLFGVMFGVFVGRFHSFSQVLHGRSRRDSKVACEQGSKPFD